MTRSVSLNQRHDLALCSLQVINHEVKELGTHILVCEVTYCNAAGEKLNFRKFFKFQVRSVFHALLADFNC